MNISIGFITGVMLGFEFTQIPDGEEDIDAIVVDLLIIRAIITYMPSD